MHNISIKATNSSYEAYFTYCSISNTQLTASILQAFLGGSFHEKIITTTNSYTDNSTQYSVYAISNDDSGLTNDAVVLKTVNSGYVVLIDEYTIFEFTLTNDITLI